MVEYISDASRIWVTDFIPPDEQERILVGNFWLNISLNRLYICVEKEGTQLTWKRINIL